MLPPLLSYLRLSDSSFLEGVPQREFDHPPVDRIQRFPIGISVLVGLGEVSVTVGKLQLHIGVVPQGVELRQGVVQEVEGFKTQLKLLSLSDVEVLVKRQIAVEKRRTLDIRPDDVSYLARSRWRKAGRVEVLPRRQALARVAGQHHNQRHGSRS